MRLQIGVCAIAWLLAGASVAKAQSQPPRTGRVEGRVLDSSGQPIGRATVALIRERAVPRAGATQSTSSHGELSSADGRFVLDAIPPGRYQLTVEKAGFLPQAYGAPLGSTEGTILDLTNGENVVDISVRLVAVAVITGRVLDENGEPQRFSSVRLYNRGYSRGDATLVNVTATVSDMSGEFRLSVGPGRYYLGAVPPRPSVTTPGALRYVTSYFPGVADPDAALALDIQPGTTQVYDVRLSQAPVVKLRGQVVGPAIPPVVILTARGQFARLTAVTASPDRDGRFEMEAVRGRYTLVATTGTNLSEVFGWVDVDVYDTDVDGVIVQATPGFDLRGRVRELDGARAVPVPGMRVVLSPDAFANAWSAALTDDSGNFVLKGLRGAPYGLTVQGVPPGSYLSSARLGNTDLLSGSVDLGGVPKNSLLDIILKPNPGELSGIVQSADGKSVRAIVTLVPVLSGPNRSLDHLYKRVTTDDRGCFVIPDVAPHKYEVYAWEAIEPGAEFSSEVLGHFEGTPVSVGEGSQRSLTIKVIPTAEFNRVR